MPPIVTLAVLCKRTSREADGFETLHSIVDGLTILDEGEAAIQLRGVVKVLSDEPGEYPLRAVVMSPTGRPASFDFRQPVTLEAWEPREWLLDLEIRPDEEGLYWFVVEVGQGPATRVPLAIRWVPDSARARRRARPE